MATTAPPVLIFYPHNFTRATSGTEKRFVELLEYFKDRNIPVDVFTLSGFSGKWPQADLQKHTRLARNLFVYEWPSQFRLAGRTILRILSGTLPNHALPGLKRAFRNVAIRGGYRHVIISYAYWADLIDGIPDVIRVLDVLDILTFNIHHRSRASHFRLGRMFESELRRISKFDIALSIAPHETAMLRSLCAGTEFHDAPMSLPEAFGAEGDFSHDLIFVGSGNPYNVRGLAWFLREVLPLLDSSTRVLLVGSVCASVEELPANVEALPYVDSLSEYYGRSKLALCPLSGGSGLKVKVVEALAHGLPVIANDFGLTGLPGEGIGSGCIRANTAQTFAEGIRALLSDSARYASARSEAQQYFKRHFGRSKAWAALDQVFVHGREPEVGFRGAPDGRPSP